MVIAVMSVYEEEELLARAIRSLRAGGVERTVCFDGAWEGFGEHPQSTDRTREVALAEGAALAHADGYWESQQAKRTHMFHHCGARPGDHVLVFDADEELEGVFPTLLRGQHYNLMVKCVGPNDMPGVRGEWPNGDYYPDYKPEVRVFAYDEELRCVFPGRYKDALGHVRAYRAGSADPALPVLEGVSFLHHGNDRSAERKAAKLSYYAREHPRRRELQAAMWRDDPW